MAGCEWEEGDQKIKIDPYNDWLDVVVGQSLEEREEETAWFPVVLQVRLIGGKRDAETLAGQLAELLGLAPETQKTDLMSEFEDLVILWHDAANFAVDLLSGHAELIIFVRRNGVDRVIGNLKGLLEAALEASVFPSSFGALISEEYIRNASPPFLPGRIREFLEMLRKYDPKADDGDECSKDVPRVITGIIDHGIGFANERFRKADDSTRVQAIWIQQGLPETSAQNGTQADLGTIDIEKTFGELGVILNKQRIDELLERLRDNELLDEIELYREAGAIEPDSRRRGDRPLLYRRTHGTQMLDIAAGYDLADAPGGHPIFAVQLPAQLVARTNGFLHEPYVKSALNWIWWEVHYRYGRRGVERLVVNYSFGDYAGRHDAQDILDADFECRIRNHKLGMLTVPSGNGFLEQIHARFSAAEVNDPTADPFLDLIVQPDGKESTFVQIWLDRAYEYIGLQLEVTPPGCPPSRLGIRKCGSNQTLVKEGHALARIYYQNHTPQHPLCDREPTNRTRIVLAIRPTADDEGGAVVAPAGPWKLRLSSHREAPIEGTVNVWVERGDTVEGFPARGRQAYLEHPEHIDYLPSGRPNEVDRYASPIKRFGTLGANSNAPSALVVGGWREKNETRVAYYSAGRSPGDGPQPTIATPSELSAARPNILASGTCSGTVRPTQGTSIASAHAARKLAAVMQEEGIDAKDAKAWILECETWVPTVTWLGPDTPRFEPERIGHGLVKVEYRKQPERIILE